jgi:pfkB family carbohydrate kinase
MGTKVAVIGTINKDTIKYPDGKTHKSFGGMLYNIVPLAVKLSKDDQIFPIANLGRDCSQHVNKILNKYPNVFTDQINIVKTQNNHCHLQYNNQTEKSEVLKGGVPPLKYNDILSALKCDLTIVNFISGRDLSLKTLERFRSEYNGSIYIDIHSLSLGKKQDGSRFLRKPSNWERYCSLADYLQMNACEFELLTGKKPVIANLKQFFSSFEKKNLLALNVTIGCEGAYLVYRLGDEIKCHIIRPLGNHPSVDPTGCGDVFSGAFCAAILSGHTLVESSKHANRIATLNCCCSGVEELQQMPLKDSDL